MAIQWLTPTGLVSEVGTSQWMLNGTAVEETTSLAVTIAANDSSDTTSATAITALASIAAADSTDTASITAITTLASIAANDSSDTTSITASAASSSGSRVDPVYFLLGINILQAAA